VDVVEGDVSLELERAVERFEIRVVLAARVIGLWEERVEGGVG
jgi:hypothetical protein